MGSCRQAQGPAAPPGAGSSTGFWAMLLRENSCTMEKMAEAVTADEASILQDFFALQADKHGPEILVRLQSIGGKPLARLEAKGVSAAVPSGACGRGEAEKPVNDPPNLPPAPTSVVAPPERNVSVIQRTPNVERPDPPKIILQRRVLDIPEHVRQEILAGIGSTDERGSSVTVKGVKGLSDPAVGSQMGRRGAQKRKVPPGQRTNQQQSDHLVCQVCGERAGKHSYYGGQVCPSCRAFFRRSVQSGYNDSFKCTQGRGNCEVTLVTRKNCQYCRYQSCLAAGMRPSWILSEEERARRSHGRTTGKGCPAPPHAVPTSLAELGEVVRWGEIARACLKGSEALDEGIIADLQQNVCPPALAVAVDRRTEECCRLLPGFSSLSEGTQRELLSQNLPLVKRLRQAVCLASSLPLSALLGFVHEASLPQTFADVNTTYRALWKGEPEALGLLEEVANWLELGDVTQLLLLLLLLLFCPDNLGEEHRPVAERVQLKYVLLLQNHLRANLPAGVAATRLARAVMLPTLLRQVDLKTTPTHQA